MNHSNDYTKVCDKPTPDNFSFLGTPDLGSSNDFKLSSIPVDRIFDDSEIHGGFYENVSGINEFESAADFSKCNAFRADTISIQKSMPLDSDWQEHAKLDDASANIKPYHYQMYPDFPFFERPGHVSLSEPSLVSAKYRGDNYNIQGIYEEDKADRYFENHSSSKNQEIHGIVYIKKAGKVYKSKIEAKRLQSGENVLFDLSHNKKLEGEGFETDGFNSAGSDQNDFDVAIFLSGITKMPQNEMQREHDQELKSNEHEESKRSKKATKNVREYDLSKVNHNTRISSYEPPSNYQRKGKSKYGLELSDYSDEVESETVPNLKRSFDNDANAMSRKRDNEEDGMSVRSRESDAVSSRTRIISQSSITRYVCEYIPTKPKVNERELWEKFEILFKTYASTSRHSGEVIPRNISTAWMKDAGVVDRILTEKQADAAFRNAAGAKITMNAQEYKEFLIMLTLRMKLPFYEIYSRMCGM